MGDTMNHFRKKLLIYIAMLNMENKMIISYLKAGIHLSGFSLLYSSAWCVSRFSKNSDIAGQPGFEPSNPLECVHAL